MPFVAQVDLEVGAICAICQDTFRQGDVIWQLYRCQHSYHHGCIFQHIKRDISAQCPLCRQEIADEDLRGLGIMIGIVDLRLLIAVYEIENQWPGAEAPEQAGRDLEREFREMFREEIEELFREEMEEESEDEMEEEISNELWAEIWEEVGRDVRGQGQQRARNHSSFLSAMRRGDVPALARRARRRLRRGLRHIRRGLRRGVRHNFRVFFDASRTQPGS